MRKYNIQLVILWCSFIIIIFIIILILYSSIIIEETNERITLLIASIGILFSLTQLFSSNINKNITFLRQIRYDEYQRVRDLLHRFFDLISGAMNNDMVAYTLVHELSTTRNELAIILNVNNNIIFHGIQNNKSIKEFLNLSEEIILRTNQLRLNIDKQNILVAETCKIDIENERINWHNEISKKIEILHYLKYELLAYIENKTIS